MIDRSMLTEAQAIILNDAAYTSAQRRERNAAENRCINDTRSRTHGRATHGVRCHRCYLVHKHGAIVARTLPEWSDAERRDQSPRVQLPRASRAETTTGAGS